MVPRAPATLLVALALLLLPTPLSAEQCDSGMDLEGEETALLQKATSKGSKLRALLVVGTEPDQPLYADLVFQERLEVGGYDVTLIKDTEVNLKKDDCGEHDAMLVSASIGAGYVKHRLDNCTTPQLIWEVGIYNFNGMTGPTNENAWVTSEWWNTIHQDSWEVTGFWPPAPTGPNIVITEEGAKSPMAAGFGPGEMELFSVSNYGMNYATVDQLGKGAKVVAILPPDSTLDWVSETAPAVHKAVLFYYEQGSELFCGRGKSPAFRIGFPPYSFIYGPSPSCEELAGVPACALCKSKCQTAQQMIASGANPMPLSCDGVKMLDAAIKVLTKEAQKGSKKAPKGKN